MWYLSWYHKASPQQKNKSLRAAMLYGVGGLLLLLVVTGRIPWLFAIFGAAVPWIHRAMSARSAWQHFRRQSEQWSNSGAQRNGGAGYSGQAGPGGQRPIESMSRDEALQVLGLEPNADQEQIVAAHRKLISRVHPDKGGSDFLAQTINHARKVLLDGNA